MIQKCDNPSCEKQIDVPNWKLELYNNFYCSRTCKDGAQKKYTEAIKDFIERNMDKKALATIARKYGFKRRNLMHNIAKLKRKKLILTPPF